jgi:hypothetical protein
MCAPRAHGRPLPGRGRTWRIRAHMTGSRARRCRGRQNRLKGVCCNECGKYDRATARAPVDAAANSERKTAPNWQATAGGASALVGTVLAAADVPAAGTPHQFADLRTLVHVCVASRGVIIEPTTQFFEPRPFSDS